MPITITQRSQAYLNGEGRKSLLSGLSEHSFFGMSREEESRFAPHEVALLRGRPLQIAELCPRENGRDYTIVLLHDGGRYELPYEHVSALFLP